MQAKLENIIFVFGSNLAGRHGKGDAKCAAVNYGAIYGQGEGRQGSSYALPTKDEQLRPLMLIQIQQHVNKFIEYATSHPELKFYLTRVGCGLTGYCDIEIAPLFIKCPKNVQQPEEWIRIQKECL